MKKLTLGLALILSLGVFANNGEIKGEDKSEQITFTQKCYLLSFDAVYYQNFKAVSGSAEHHEKYFYGTYDAAVTESENFKNSFNYYPLLNWSNGTGWSVPVSEPQEMSRTKCLEIIPLN
ncbi:hypothetical protein [Myroides odoratus]|uniref:hypothetical protein n=1 Tax=Myroides odoratus TaxID=256 RepID=UPI000765A1BB|nr:hypothetical protein [Myroides odoratus]